MGEECEFPQQGTIVRGDRYNILMELLKQTAFKEDRRTYSNNFTPVQWTQETYKGKYFVRGMRGLIDRIHIYAKNDGAVDGTITITITNYPLSGIDVETVTITIPAGSEDWFTATPLSALVPTSIAWNYDMCFLYISDVTGADVWYGFDQSPENPDAWTSPDSGTTWRGEAGGHYHLKVDLLGQTVGDVPVTGFVNIKEVEQFIKVAITNPDGVIVGEGLPYYLTTILGGETAFNNLADAATATVEYAAGDPFTEGWIADYGFYPNSIRLRFALQALIPRQPFYYENEQIEVNIATSGGTLIYNDTIGKDTNTRWAVLTTLGVDYYVFELTEEINHKKVLSTERIIVTIQNLCGFEIAETTIQITGVPVSEA